MPALSWTSWQGVSIKSKVVQDLPGPCANAYNARAVLRRDNTVLFAPNLDEDTLELATENQLARSPTRGTLRSTTSQPSLRSKSTTFSLADPDDEDQPSLCWTWDDLTAPSARPKGGKINFAYTRKRRMSSHMAKWFVDLKQSFTKYRNFQYTVPTKRQADFVSAGYRANIPPEFRNFGQYVQQNRDAGHGLNSGGGTQQVAIAEKKKPVLDDFGMDRSETQSDGVAWDDREAAFELHLAMQFNDVQRVRLLVQHRHVPADLPNDNGWTAALCAARDGYASCVAALLSGRADPLRRCNSKRHFGDGIWPDEEMPDQWGAQPKVGTSYPPQAGRTVVYLMCMSKIIDEVLVEIDPPARMSLVRSIADAIYEWHGKSPLRVAAEQGKPHLAAVLLANIAAFPTAPPFSEEFSARRSLQYETSPEDRVDALLEALASQEWKVAEVMTAAGLSRKHLDNRRRKLGMSCLHIAVRAGKEKLVKSILACSASPLVYNDYGRQPLHEACAFGEAGVLQILLAADADPHAVVKNGKSCLGARSAEVGKTPLEVAKTYGHMHLASFFYDPDYDPELLPATAMHSSITKAGRKSIRTPTAP